MASVRMSQDMRSRILQRAVDAFQTANPEWKASNEFQSKVKRYINSSKHQNTAKQIDAILKANKPTGLGLQKLGTKKEKYTEVHLKRPATAAEKANNLVQWNSEDMTLTVEFDSPVTWHTCPDRYSDKNMCFTIDSFDEEHQTEIQEFMDSALKEKQEHKDKFLVYRTQIQQLLENCNTLKQLLETWPAAESLVDQDHIEKMHTKVTRASAAKQRRESVSFDADAANQAVLTAKLVGG